MNVRLVCLLYLLPLAGAWAESTPNGGFEAGFESWSPKAWARDTGTAEAVIDPDVHHAGTASARITHRGTQDWSFERAAKIAVAPDDIYEMEVWIRGEGELGLSVVTYGPGETVQSWRFGGSSLRADQDWQVLRTRFLVPPGVEQVRARLTGNGPVALWVDDFAMQKTGSVAARRQAMPGELTISNCSLDVTFRTADSTLTVTDKRNGKTWRQAAMTSELALLSAAKTGQQLNLVMFYGSGGTECKATVSLDSEAPELVAELCGQGKMLRGLVWPQPFAGGSDLIVPMNEGISFPVDDESIAPLSLITYGGHGICMPWWGLADGNAGQLAIFESPNDAAIRMERRDGKLLIAPEWQAQKGELGYPRRLRYCFVAEGGYVAMAKRYRQYAKDTGLFKTLAEKRRELPATDLLVGAANIWCWDKDGPARVRELRAAGIERILWSNQQSPENLKALNDLGVLTSRYDIYQDTMDPAQFPRLRYLHGDWTTEAWPKDLMRDATGDWIKGWEVSTKDGEMVPCGVLCDLRAPDYARRRIPAELATHPYRCRFIDTTTASSWRECYDPAHPVTRTESRRTKMELLGVVSGENKLVCGSETGHDAAVPVVHYFEGMLSLGPYRVPDAGRNTAKIWDEVPERVAKFQLGERYRLPLWELVYHDCVVAQWYWGDYNNKLPALWDKRDLFNALYGTPPMFMFDRNLWEQNRDRFVQSYQATCPVARDTGYVEMTEHRWLTPDRSVQQTRFANGVTVTVNFGGKPYALEGGEPIPPLGRRVSR